MSTLAEGILATLHIQNPMWLILDPSMAADRLREALWIGERAQEIAVLRGGVLANDAGGRDPPHGLESGPVGFGRQPRDLVG